MKKTAFLDAIVMYPGRTLLTFRRKVQPPSSGSKSKQRKQSSFIFANLAYFSILMIEAVFFSETPVNFYHITFRDHIPE